MVSDDVLRHVAVEVFQIILDGEVHIGVGYPLQNQTPVTEEILHNFGLATLGNLRFQPHQPDTAIVPMPEIVADGVVQFDNLCVIGVDFSLNSVALHLFKPALEAVEQLANPARPEVVLLGHFGETLVVLVGVSLPHGVDQSQFLLGHTGLLV